MKTDRCEQMQIRNICMAATNSVYRTLKGSGLKGPLNGILEILPYFVKINFKFLNSDQHYESEYKQTRQNECGSRSSNPDPCRFESNRSTVLSINSLYK